MGEEKKIEIENAEELAKYIGKLFVLQHGGYTPEKKWSYMNGKLVPYTRDAVVHVIFDVHSDVISVTVESKEDVSEFDLKIQLTKSEDELSDSVAYYTYVNSKYISYKQAWAIAYRNLKKMRKIYGEDKYIIIPYAFSGRRRNYAYTFVFPKSLLLNYANRIYNEINRLLQEEKEETTEETSEEISVEEALEGWTTPTAVGVEEIIEKAEERKEEVKREIERSFEEEVKRLGLEKVKLITFTNPTEYRFAVRRQVEALREEIEFEKDPAIIRRTRVLFYARLKNVAYRTEMGWFAYKRTREEDWKRLDEIVQKMNELANASRKIYILDVYVPKSYIREKILENIMRKRTRIRELEEKLKEIDMKTEKKVAQRVARDLKELEKEVKRLEEELKYY